MYKKVRCNYKAVVLLIKPTVFFFEVLVVVAVAFWMLKSLVSVEVGP